jgi:transposase
MNHQERRARRATIAKNVSAGMTINDAASKFRVTRRTVYNACREHGIVWRTERNKHDLRSSRDVAPSTYRILAWLLHTPFSYARIAKENCLTRQRVYAIANKARATGILVPQRLRNPRPLRADRKIMAATAPMEQPLAECRGEPFDGYWEERTKRAVEQPVTK